MDSSSLFNKKMATNETSLSPAQLRLLKRKNKILNSTNDRLSKISGVSQQHQQEQEEQVSSKDAPGHPPQKSPGIVFASDKVDERVQDLMAQKKEKERLLLKEEQSTLQKETKPTLQTTTPLPDVSSLETTPLSTVSWTIPFPKISLRSLTVILLCSVILWQYPDTHLWLDSDHIAETFPLNLGVFGSGVPSWTLFLTIQAVFSLQTFLSFVPGSYPFPPWLLSFIPVSWTWYLHRCSVLLVLLDGLYNDLYTFLFFMSVGVCIGSWTHASL